MASAGHPSPNSKRTERGLRRRPSRVSFTQDAKGPNDVDGGRQDLPSRRKVVVQTISPSDDAPSSHTTSSPTADKPDDELLKKAKGFIDELYQQIIALDNKYSCFEYHREKMVFYLAVQQKHEYVSRHIKDLNRSKGRGATQAEDEAISRKLQKAKAEIARVDLEVNQAIEDLQRAHRELVKQKEKGFGVGGIINDKPNVDIEAFSENILKILSICAIHKMIDVLSYLNKAVEALHKLCNTYNGEEISKLKEEYNQLLKDRKRLQQRQQSASEQASTATTKSTANPDTYHSNVVKLYQRAENMRYQENANSQWRKLSVSGGRKLEAPGDAKIVECISATPIIP
ncbi:hypothetical protein ACEPAI_10092 [Sanghuangporus weigelae]